MDKGIVERGVDVSNAENELSFSNLGTESNGLLLLNLDFLGGLKDASKRQLCDPTTKSARTARSFAIA